MLSRDCHAIMKTLMTIKLVFLGALIVAVFYLLRGHDALTGLALVLLFLFAVAKILFAIICRRRGSPPDGGGGGSLGKPMKRPPTGRPPELTAAKAITDNQI